jgi:hypothetical protein
LPGADQTTQAASTGDPELDKLLVGLNNLWEISLGSGSIRMDDLVFYYSESGCCSEFNFCRMFVDKLFFRSLKLFCLFFKS